MQRLLHEYKGEPRNEEEMLILELKNLNPGQIKDICSILEVEPVIAAECSMIHAVDKLDIFGHNSFIIHASLIVRQTTDPRKKMT